MLKQLPPQPSNALRHTFDNLSYGFGVGNCSLSAGKVYCWWLRRGLIHPCEGPRRNSSTRHTAVYLVKGHHRHRVCLFAAFGGLASRQPTCFSCICKTTVVAVLSMSGNP